MNHKIDYSCDKCGDSHYSEGKVNVAGAGLTRFLNIQNNRFVYVACSSCGYTEFYRAGKSGAAATLLDLFTN
ncbi:MAG TPA: GTP-binding protein [Dehalococcoidia bacterium]|jgi:predicted nucleic-acid-binding Zn-ribbon protein|nr:GTP-binding protein [Dehalococcoidia bacterium]|tara:strand:+ start:921 stop:1136 length:216 start_codon:yes stop_codon:yes gene_type:complete